MLKQVRRYFASGTVIISHGLRAESGIISCGGRRSQDLGIPRTLKRASCSKSDLEVFMLDIGSCAVSYYIGVTKDPLIRMYGKEPGLIPPKMAHGITLLPKDF